MVLFSDFQLVRNHKYGNCFTFKAPGQTTKCGSQYGKYNQSINHSINQSLGSVRSSSLFDLIPNTMKPILSRGHASRDLVLESRVFLISWSRLRMSSPRDSYLIFVLMSLPGLHKIHHSIQFSISVNFYSTFNNLVITIEPQSTA